jgi:tRNA threonylcarbamoyladenosine biosynthesis protein TsaE
MRRKVLITSAPQMKNFGKLLAQEIYPYPILIFLQGDLGAGKTTLAQGFLHALGYKGKIKSPTFALLEDYHFKKVSVVHCDLYRLIDSEELEYIGFREYFDGKKIVLLEWPEKGKEKLPHPDLICKISVVPEGRKVEIIAGSELGKKVILSISHSLGCLCKTVECT